MYFNSTGELSWNAADAKLPAVKNGKTKNGADYISINLRIAESKNNSMFIECFGMVQDELKLTDVDGNKINVKWADRKDPDIIKVVSNMRKYIIVLGDERYEFISAYDFCEFIANNLERFKDGKFTVSGQVNKNVYNGKISDRFTFSSIYSAAEDKKNALKVTGILFFNKDSFDTDDWAESKKLTINGYTQEYIDKDNPSKYVPKTLILDCSKVDFTNEKHLKVVKFRLKCLGLDLDENNKIKINVKSKTYYKIAFESRYYNGAEEVEFSESMLTPMQKEQIELGFKTIDDFKPKSNVFGPRVVVYKLTDFNLRGDYADGYIDTEITSNEFEEDIYVPTAPQTESMATIEKAVEEASTSDDIDDLFS